MVKNINLHHLGWEILCGGELKDLLKGFYL